MHCCAIILEWSVGFVYKRLWAAFNLLHMESLSRSMSDLSMAQKRSFVFLQEEQDEEHASKKSTRMELVRAQSRRDSLYQNMLKSKERTKAIIEKFREQETAYEAAKQDVARLKALLKDDV